MTRCAPKSPKKHCGTSERIQRAIDALGYRVDQGARSLRRGQTQTVGLIVPNISNPFYAELARAIEHRLWDRGFQTFLCDSAHDAVRERAHFLNLLDRRADGILVIYDSEASDLPELAGETNTPVVFLDRPVKGQLSVASDNFLGGRLAAQHLLALGHTCIGALVGDAEISNMRSRMGGFSAALAEGGIVEVRAVAEQLKQAGIDVPLILEVFYPFEQDDETVEQDIIKSAQRCRAALEEV